MPKKNLDDFEGPYVWSRQEWETTPAWEAFREYQRLRNTTKVGESLGKADSLIRKWSGEHLWIWRVKEMDNHIQNASVDDHVEELAAVKRRHMAITDKLLDHLDKLLDQFIERKSDVSVRWTNAFIAATKAQEAALRLRPIDIAQAGKLDRIRQQLEEVLEG